MLTSVVTYSPYVFHSLYYLPAADDRCHTEAGPDVLSGDYNCQLGCYHGGTLVSTFLE